MSNNAVNLHHHLSAETFDSLYPLLLGEVLRDGTKSAPRGMPQREIQGLTYEVRNPWNPYLDRRPGIDRHPNYEYGEHFFDWILSGETEMPQSLIDLNPMAANFNPDVKPEEFGLPSNFSFFYGPRIHAQLDSVIEELKRDPDTRRATITILDGINDNAILGDLASGTIKNAEYPCTISLSFQIRDGELECHNVMRSQNMVSVWPYDFLNFSLLQRHVAEAVGVSLGRFRGYVVSCHIYERDEDFVRSFVEA